MTTILIMEMVVALLVKLKIIGYVLEDQHLQLVPAQKYVEME